MELRVGASQVQKGLELRDWMGGERHFIKSTQLTSTVRLLALDLVSATIRDECGLRYR